jgi:hypothetical protein
MAVIYTPHFVQFFDNNGDPLSGGKLYTYSPGTTTPKATYTAADGLTSNANPVVLDSAGRAVLFLSGAYKFRLEDSLGNLIKETDEVTAFSTATSGVDDITTNFAADTIVDADSIIFSDASDGGTTKRTTITNMLASASDIRAGTANKLVNAATYSSVVNVIGTEQATTSGTSIDFTGIPSGVKKIMVHFMGVSTSGTSNWIIQLGDAGGVETSGYVSNGSRPSVLSTTSTAGILALVSPVAAETATGCFTFYLVGANKWSGSGVISTNGGNGASVGSGYKTLSETLDRVRITTAGGADTFDAGAINITYS